MEDRAAGETIGRLTSTVLDTPDPEGLATFYGALLGWPMNVVDATWVTLRPADGGPGLSFQLEPDHVAPTWPAAKGDQRMQSHLDIEVLDLDVAAATAVRLGAQVAEFQPQADVRVMLDPAGHPFCLWVEG